MSTFSMNIQSIKNEDYIIMSGVIDEDAKFEGFDKTTSSLTLDLESVEYINSCGIREWINWVEKHVVLYDEVKILNCPYNIIEVANVVASFFKPNFKVNSFYVPYYVADTDEAFYKLFIKEADYSGGKLELPEMIDTLQGKAELDVIPEKFLKFLSDFI